MTGLDMTVGAPTNYSAPRRVGTALSLLVLLASVMGCSAGQTTPAGSAGIADSAASSATRMPPPAASGKAPSAP